MRPAVFPSDGRAEQLPSWYLSSSSSVHEKSDKFPSSGDSTWNEEACMNSS